ncbi:sugar phosphate isomerase/epimerase family protein [Halococcus hamelinensis]|uniref:Xylose isomerase n=1 Tax=Halococcus hamelinensis 100A6 TaxID=1132509 RepID=M0LWT2_9EURY|nr:sugar phosphate isomerase/epimerase family protein [Halococcus hamelinensis]EMA37931.1 xylose isomerase [Halococcus hamelinensis 100A6]
MNFGFSANAFREYDPYETIEIVADAGYDGVELLFDRPHLYPPDTDEETVERVKETLAENDLAISNCNAFMLTAIEGFHHPSYIEPDTDYRQRRIDYTKDALRTAAALDHDYISIEPGGPIPEEKSREWALETFVESLEEVLPVAEEVGVDLHVEPEPDLLIETADEYLEFVERISHPQVRCNFDAGHLFSVGEDPVAAYETLSEYVDHVHLEDIPEDRRHEHTQLGEGAMDIDGFLGALDDAGYEEFVTVELYPYEETAAETVEDAMAYLETHGWA